MASGSRGLQVGGRPLCWDRADPEVGEAGLTSLSGLKEGPGGPGGPCGPGGPLGPTPGSPCEQKTQLYQGACPHIGSGWRTAHDPPTPILVTTHLLALGAHISWGSWEALWPSVPLEDRGQAARSGEGLVPCPWPSHHRYVAVCPYSSAEQTGSGPRGGGDIMGAAVGTTGLGDVSPSREQRPTEVTAVSHEHQAGGRHSVHHTRAVGAPRTGEPCVHGPGEWAEVEWPKLPSV